MRVLNIFYVIVGIIFLLSINIWYYSSLKNNEMQWGVSFSAEYARYLGLNPADVFKTILDTWKFKYLRLSAQWNEIEPVSGKIDFKELDYFFAEANKRQAKIILALGQKTPRWPECHVPEWTQKLSDNDYQTAKDNYFLKVVEHYKDNPALEIWQVENEPFLSFGLECREMNTDILKKEIELVKKNSQKPIMVTDSGELSLWRKTVLAGDIFGTTVYRVVWNKILGYITYDWVPPAYYRWRAVWQGRDIRRAYVAELQGEPWVPDQAVSAKNIDEQLKSMDIKRLEKNLDFARRTGFARGYLWGAEWWYWMQKNNHSEFSDYIKNLQK